MQCGERKLSRELLDLACKLKETYPTPFYIFDIDGMQTTYREFVKTFSKFFPSMIVAYSYKTNSLKVVTQRLAKLGSSAEVVSGHEMAWALNDGFTAAKIFFDGPIKKREELDLAISHGVRVQIDSLDELELFLSLSRRLSHRNVSLRLSTMYKKDKRSRFGFERSEFFVAVERLKVANVKLSGLHFHVGSNVLEPEIYSSAIYEFREQIKTLFDETYRNGAMPWIDIGGGYPAKSGARKSDDVIPPLDDFASAARAAFDRLVLDVNTFTLVLEPGRHLVEDFGFLIADVYAKKQRNGKDIIVLNGGNNLLRSVNNWFHPLYIQKDGPLVDADIYGANCFESDLWYQSVKVPANLRPGDTVVIGSAGGYDLPSCNLWTRGLPPIFAIDAGQISLVRTESDVGYNRYNEVNSNDLTTLPIVFCSPPR